MINVKLLFLGNRYYYYQLYALHKTFSFHKSNAENKPK